MLARPMQRCNSSGVSLWLRSKITEMTVSIASAAVFCDIEAEARKQLIQRISISPFDVKPFGRLGQAGEVFYSGQHHIVVVIRWVQKHDIPAEGRVFEMNLCFATKYLALRLATQQLDVLSQLRAGFATVIDEVNRSGTLGKGLKAENTAPCEQIQATRIVYVRPKPVKQRFSESPHCRTQIRGRLKAELSSFPLTTDNADLLGLTLPHCNNRDSRQLRIKRQ